MAYVYRFRHYLTNEIIYVGKTKRDINTRINEHFKNNGHLPKKCYENVGKIEYLEVASDADALLVELYLINKYKPKYNTNGKAQDSQSLKYTLPLNIIIRNKWILHSVKRTSFVGFRLLRIFSLLKPQKIKEPKDLVDLIFNFVIFYIILSAIIEFINSTFK